MKTFLKPGEKGSLISKDAQDELDRQDAARAQARTTATSAGFRANFSRAIAYEFELADKWGAEADTVGDPPVVTRSIRAKYPPRQPGKFLSWLFQFRNNNGIPIFQINPAPFGFIINEGGRGITLTCTRAVPFRLYVAGYVVMWHKNKLTFRGRPKPFDGFRKMLK